MSIVNQYNLFLDTKYRNGGTNTSPIFFIQDPIILSNPNNYFKATIINADIPFSFKTLASPNNVLKLGLVVPQHSVDVSSNITLTEGNYSITNLLDELTTQITTWVNANKGTLNQVPTYDFQYDRNTGKAILNIIPPSGGSHDFTLTIYNSLSDILVEMWGFTFENETILSYNTSGVVTSSNYISPNHVNVSPITALYIRSTSLHQLSNNQERLVEQQFTISDVLAKIPVNTYYNTWLLYEGNFSVSLNNNHIEELTFYLTTNTYTPINLSGIHWRLTLQITEIETEATSMLRDNEKKKYENMIQQKQALIEQLNQIRDDLSKKTN
jgi:hypothetical protein